MPDIYLCGNGSSNATDITLRRAVACTSTGTPTRPRRRPVFGYLEPPAPPVTVQADLTVALTISAFGTVAAQGEHTIRIEATGEGQVLTPAWLAYSRQRDELESELLLLADDDPILSLETLDRLDHLEVVRPPTPTVHRSRAVGSGHPEGAISPSAPTVRAVSIPPLSRSCPP